MKIVLIFLILTLSANVLAQPNTGFDFWSGFGNGGYGQWTGFGQHNRPGIGIGFIHEPKPMMMDVGEKPCLSYEPCEGPGYATGAGYGYGMTPVYTSDFDNDSTGYGHSFYQRPVYNNYLNNSGRGYNQKFDLNYPAGSNIKMLPSGGAAQ